MRLEHATRGKGTANKDPTAYRPRPQELPTVPPELTSELLHCLSTLPDPWPLAKITINMDSPSQWVSKMGRLFFADEHVKHFFSSSLADVALMARSLHVSKQQKHLYKDARSLKSANRLKQNKTNKHTKATTRKSPSQTCVSPAEKAKQKAGKHQNKTGPEPKRKHPQNRFAPGSSGKSTASLSKTCKQTNYVSQLLRQT